MKPHYSTRFLLTAFFLLSAFNLSFAQVEERNVRAQMNFLASDAMQGRGSGTQFELLAGEYIASQMQQFGVEPGTTDAAGNLGYVQTVSITRNSFAESPKLIYSVNGQLVTLEHGKEMLVSQLRRAETGGKLQKINLGDKPAPDAVAFVRLLESEADQLQKVFNINAATVLVEETPAIRARWETVAARKITFSTVSGKSSTAPNVIFVSKDAAEKLSRVADGTQIEIKGLLDTPQTQSTYNAIGKLEGKDKILSAEVILLSAHMDHLGMRPNATGDDKIFNGADDDASGCVAVLELARELARGERPKRTVYFVFFGSEEAGGFGARYFVDNLPFPKDKLAANLEFEMIGRPDEKVKPEELWLTGYERSNLGPELAKRGAKLVQDPHPDQNFFQRSDNYTLARQGIIAHTVSSFGLHKDYHQASDEVKTINFMHMTQAINSMVKPVQWLVNSDFKPAWNEDKDPSKGN